MMKDLEANDAKFIEQRDERHKTVTSSLMSRIDEITGPLVDDRLKASSTKVDDPAVDAAVAMVEAKVRQMELSALRGSSPTNTCVLVTPPRESARGDESQPLAAALAASITSRGWAVLPIHAALENSVSEAPSAEAIAACAKGAVVIVCPELESRKSGGMFGGQGFLAPVEPSALQRLLKGLEVIRLANSKTSIHLTLSIHINLCVNGARTQNLFVFFPSSFFPLFFSVGSCGCQSHLLFFVSCFFFIFFIFEVLEARVDALFF